MRTALRILTIGALVGAAPPAQAGEDVDLIAVHRIKNEAFRHSQVMDHLFYLTDVHGPRLAGSPAYRKAAGWTVTTIKGWGIPDARLEGWGEFGRSWTLDRFAAHMMAPAYMPIAGSPLAWSAGTSGPVTAETTIAPLFTDENRGDRYDLEKLAVLLDAWMTAQRGKLRGRIVLIDPVRELPPPTAAASARYTPESLDAIARAPEPVPLDPLEWPIVRMPKDDRKQHQMFTPAPIEMTSDFWIRQTRQFDRLNAFLRDEGVVAVLTADRRGDGGLVFAEEAGSWERGAPIPPPVLSIQPEQYARIHRLTDRGMSVKIEIEVRARIDESDPEGYNVVAEIPGGRKREEVVMLGAHLDSWHAGTGAADNAAGCAVVMEALRILKVLGLPLDRSVRLALWGSEEQGLFGSRRYVAKHFADPITMKTKPEHSRLAGYFNIDNGSGKIRGVYLQGNDMVRPIFAAWLEPFHDLGATTLSIDWTGGTDHQSFDSVGLPGFQFIQDPLDYSSRTHHSNLDVYDHAQPSDLMQASAILASFVYHAANRPEMLPRKPLPKPLPPKKETTAAGAR